MHCTHEVGGNWDGVVEMVKGIPCIMCLGVGRIRDGVAKMAKDIPCVCAPSGRRQHGWYY